MRDLRPLLAPASIAILGASSRPDSIGGRPLANLQGHRFGGPIYPVNPRRDEIAGLPCYPSVEDLPAAPELALLLLPAEHVLPALESCVRRGVRAAIVVSAGFAEAGAEGERAQARIGALARASGMVVCGPNSLGLLNYVQKIPLTFGSAEDMERWPAGKIGLVSQSGGIMVGLANRAFDARIGVSYAIATGNEADLDLVDVLEYLAEDPQTRVLVAVIEVVRDGPRFLALCDRLLQVGKPLLAYKIGRSAAGSAAARSHTGALAGSYAALQSVFRQRGVIEVPDLDDLFDVAAACAAGRFPAGNRLAALTESGGAGAIIADRAEELGLAVPAFGDRTVERLREFIPSFGAGVVENPFDATAMIIENPASVGAMAEILLDDPGLDGLVVITAGSGAPGLLRAQSLARHVERSTKPVFEVVLAGSSAMPTVELLAPAGIPVFHSPGRAVETMAALHHFARARERRRELSDSSAATAELRERVRRALAALGPRPTEHEAKRFLAEFGVALLDERLATSVEEAVLHAEAIGYPVALKVQSPDIAHKTEVGGVRLNLRDAAEVQAAYDAMMTSARSAVPGASIPGVLVCQMIATPLELIAGVHVDPTFGPLVLFGLGGIWVEVFDDVAMRPAPLSPEDALEMLDDLRGAPLLRGARNLPPVRPDAIQQLLLTLSDLAIASRGILSGIDINPLVPASDGRLVAVDVMLYLEAQEC